MIKRYKHFVMMLICGLLLITSHSFAAIETPGNSKKGAIHVGDTLSVADDKFVNGAHWATINNLSVQDVISFRMLETTYMNYAFSTNIQLKLQYYTAPSQTTPFKDTTINLSVNYSPAQGTTYKGTDNFSFNGAYRILLTVLSISSPEIGTSLPPDYQLGASITIDRKYQFQPAASIGFQRTFISTGGSSFPANQLHLSLGHPEGAEEFDVEWTTVNSGNPYWQNVIGTAPQVDSTMEKIFRNNASRITTSDDTCSISMLSNDAYLLVRVRQVQYSTDGVRIEGQWNYHQNSSAYGIWPLSWNEPNLNWQYSAAFAEDGKKKEVISYYDGTLRGRQTVTINNTDNVGVVQENVYDEFGRTAASILPAPFKDVSGYPYLHYVQKFNLNTSNTPYNFTNVSGTSISASCEPNPDALSMSNGASKYYSASNPFANNTTKLYNNYIPDAAGFPLSVTQYTADNTGRIKVQGGVGQTFQPGKNFPSYTTKYYYGKPEQWELDQLFGNDAGFAEHYTKNMVMDPNGQISISYLNASGKTIATALTGSAPSTVDPLPSYSVNTQTQNITLLKPNQFVYDATALKLNATTTYLASVKDTSAMLKYNIQTLVSNYPGGAFQICSSCYYELRIKIVNDCGDTTDVKSMPVKIGSADTATCVTTPTHIDSIKVKFLQPGEYYVTFEFALNKGVIEDYVDNFVKKGTRNGYLHSEFSFIKPYLDSLDFAGCLGNCSVCVKNLGAKPDFINMFTTSLRNMSVDSISLASTSYTNWVSNKYDSLKTVCDTMQAHCDMKPCNVQEQEMESDIAPGGQYSLFTSNGTPLEPNINILSNNWRTVFPVKAASDTLYKVELITKEDGTTTSPYDANFTLAMLVHYWKPEWAALFLTYHPENCKLQFCYNMSTYENWDLQVTTFITKAADIPGSKQTLGASYDHNNAAWLVNSDPFFRTLPGSKYKGRMETDLLQYSKNVLGITQSGATVKSLTQFIDYSMYCADTTGNTNINTSAASSSWNYCIPQDTCRVPDREWQAYQSYYFALKKKYYTKLRDTTTCLGVCPVGTGTSVGTNNTNCPKPQDIVIQSAAGSCGNGLNGINLSYTAASGSQQVTVNLYYSTGIDTTALPMQVVLAPGVTSKTFCLPDTIPLAAIHIRSVLGPCGTNVNGVVMPVTVITPPTTIFVTLVDVLRNTVTDVTTNTSIDHRRTTATLVNASGAAIGPLSNDVTVYFQYGYHPISYSTITTSTAYLTIPAGSTSAANNYTVGPRDDYTDYDSFLYQDLYCIEYSTGASLLPGTALCSGGVAPTPTATTTTTPVTACSIYADKISYFDNVSTTVTGTVDTAAAMLQAKTQLKQAIDTSCVSNADNWISILKPGLASHSLLSYTDTLKRKLIELCEAGGDVNHLSGASVLAAGQVSASGYHSFGDVMKGVLPGLTTFSQDLNPWLISSPYPFAPPAQQSQIVLSATNSDICNKLSSLRANYNTYKLTHTDNGFFAYLQATYGDAMNISSTELAAIEKSCSNCRFILATNIVEPVFLQPNATGCIVGDAYIGTRDSLQLLCGNSLDTSLVSYHTILTNYMNQHYGFALGYDDYHNYEILLATQPHALLCNRQPFHTIQQDNYSCLKSAISVASVNGINAYQIYIEGQKTNFRESYVATCSAARALVGLRTQSQVYHYTLYYYDQADNLIRTIPPEGVHLIEQAKFGWIDSARSVNPATCDGTFAALSASGFIHTDVNGSQKVPAFNKLSDLLASPTGGTIEMWLYNSGGLANQIIQQTPDGKFLFQVCICGNLMNVDVYSSIPNGSNSITYTLSNKITVNIAGLMPLHPWSHVAVRSTNFVSGALQVFLNGISPPVVAGAPPAGCSWSVTANATSVTYPDNISTLKHLRLYYRYLSDAEIKINATSNCFLPSSLAALYWYRFNVPVAGGPTTIAANSTDETRLVNIYPDHTLPTSYVYNSTNQVIKQYSPDGGTNRFWYDMLSRLVASQNDKQLADINYSYTRYDQLGRIIQVGQKNNPVAPPYISGSNQLPDYMSEASVNALTLLGASTQVTTTYYDIPVPASGTNGIANIPGQGNLRKRVAASSYQDISTGPVTQATYYNYDIDGNVKTLWQQVNGLGIKRLDYEYDLVSGKVNFVRYQDGRPDRFYYQYKYDADNRLTDAWSATRAIVDSANGSDLLIDNKKLDAHYEYYLHGPLARMELGDEHAKIQGVDYAYTLQGWLKGVNAQQLNPVTDIGKDGYTLHSNNGVIARDAFGYALGYYQGDYQPIGGSSAQAFNLQYNAQPGDITGQNLYNGNISSNTLALSAINSGAPIGYTYRYDQLNRLKKMRQHSGITGSVWNSTSISQAYKEDVSYDANGNILTYQRNGSAADSLAADSLMDKLSYSYNTNTAGLINNRLRHIKDAVPDNNNYTNDLKNQADDNYAYDAIGNLIHDTQAGINGIDWTVYGKIQTIHKNTGNITYTYNPAGQRVSKTYNNLTTWYVRDAQGNTLALYDGPATGGNTTWREQHLYGSSRLGLWTPNIDAATGIAETAWDTVGHKFYELNNHLGNVLSTVTDRRVQHDSGDPLNPDYLPDVANANDYYPFGSLMPGRSYTANNINYRYGFNGKENDKDIQGNDYDYSFRIYNPQIGKFLSLDPLQSQFPWYTPYQFSGNSPIANVDLDGREDEPYWKHLLKVLTGRAPQPQNAEEAIEQSNEVAAVQQVATNVQKMGEAYETTFGMVPGVSAAFEFSKGNTKTGVANLVLDVFGEELFRYAGKGLKYIKPQELFRIDINATKLFGDIATSEGKFVVTVKNVAKSGERAWYKYQKQINGLSGSVEFLRNGVKFDGFKNGVLLEAKSQFQWLFKTGRATEEEIYGKMSQQLGRQIDAAGGLKLEWNFAEKETMDGFKNFLKETKTGQQMLDKVELKYTPVKK